LHELFFASLGEESAPEGEFRDALARDFGSFDRWLAEFSAMGKAQGGGSGWVLLTWSPRDRKLVNQWAMDHTTTLAGATPILARYVSRLRLPRCHRAYDLSSAEIAGGGNRQQAGDRSARPVAADRIYLGRVVQSRLVWRRFFVQSLLALWLFDHFGLSLTAAGSLFFWSGLLSALSYPVAVRLARRIGLVNTMVFTHLPSNVCLMLVPFAPTLEIAIALLLIRSTLSQMDVPARTSYVMAVVTPPERPAAASITAAPRSLAGAASPVLTGYLLGLSSFGWPLVIGGSFNSLYDLLLLFMFRRVRPPEEQVSADLHGDVSSAYHVVDPSVTPTRT
jgi:hypothetical protein